MMVSRVEMVSFYVPVDLVWCLFEKYLWEDVRRGCKPSFGLVYFLIILFCQVFATGWKKLPLLGLQEMGGCTG